MPEQLEDQGRNDHFDVRWMKVLESKTVNLVASCCNDHLNVKWVKDYSNKWRLGLQWLILGMLLLQLGLSRSTKEAEVCKLCLVLERTTRKLDY